MVPRNKLLADLARHEAQRLIRMVAEPLPPHEPAKTSIARVAALLEWPYARAEDIWNRDARRIDSWEMDALRSVAQTRVRRSKEYRTRREK